MVIWSKSDVALYLADILGHAPTADRKGRMRVPGPTSWCRQQGHEALMDIRTGSWTCPNCRAGNLEEYEFRRSPDRSPLGVIRAIEEAIRIEQDKAVERAQQAEALIAHLALSGAAATLLRKVFRSPGTSRRYLQQVSHVRRGKFNTTIRDLERNGLIFHQDTGSTAQRKRRLYFPTPLYRSPGFPHVAL